MTTISTIHDQSSPCITHNEMLAYLSGSLSAADMHRIELHMLECDMCADEFEGLQLLENPESIVEITDSLTSRIRSSIETKRSIRFVTKKAIMIAASIMIICGVGLLMLLLAPNDSHHITEIKHTILYTPQNKGYSNDTAKQNNLAYIPTEKPPKNAAIEDNKNHEIEQSAEPKVELEDVIIENAIKIGYASEKKEDWNAPITVASPEDIAQKPVISIDQAMQGKAAGVQVRSNSGTPGAEMDIVIRGKGSTNDSRPLYVVDGVPVGYEWSGDPNTIESISILKDASSCAIYGARGANGVILITTKYGSKTYNRASYKLGNEKDFTKKIVKTIQSQITVTDQNTSIDVFCKIDSKGAIRVMHTSIRNQGELENKIIQLLESNNDWKPAIENNIPIESNYIFSFDFGK